MRYKITSLTLMLLSVGVTWGHSHHRVHQHQDLQHRGVATEVVVFTTTVVYTVIVDPEATNVLPSSSSATVTTEPSVSSIIVAPTPSAPKEDLKIGGNPFHALIPVANSASVKNSCSYPVYISSVGHKSCDGEEVKGQLIEANGTYVEKLRVCSPGSIAFKISKGQDGRKPMQFEYSVWDTNKEKVSYDISYLDCMREGVGVKDLSECVGHEGGIQATSGSDCPKYHCLANEWCDKLAYVVAEFDYKHGAPVGTCNVDEGVAFELCAGA